MDIYHGQLELLDYVFFATVERGKVYETGAFIHNYALAYALKLAASPYTHRQQKPHYAEELADLNQRGVYLTPAHPHPTRLFYRLMQWNTIQETYGFGKKAQSIGYPDWGFARVLRPGSTFEFYVMVADAAHPPPSSVFRDLLAGHAGHIRLGKFMAKARLYLTRASRVEAKQGAFTADIRQENKRSGARGTPAPILLNWRDLTANPVVCDVYPATLPTRLIARPRFADSNYYLAHFGEQFSVTLPGQMSFLARSD